MKHILQRGSSMARAILVEVMYPKVCPACGMRGVWLCELCRDTVPPLDHAMSSPCELARVESGHERHSREAAGRYVDSARAAYPYTGWAAASIRRFKYGDEPMRADDLASRMLPMLAAFGTIDVVVPVPLHASKLNLRGYNQSELLATRIAAHLDLPMKPILIRSKATKPQVTLDQKRRRDNMVNAFSRNPEWVIPTGQRVLLIDDVRTTGATTEACAQVLKDDARAHSVSVLTFAQELADAELHQWMQSLSVSPPRR